MKLHSIMPKIIADESVELLNRSIHVSLDNCTKVGANDDFYIISFDADDKKSAPQIFQAYRILTTDEMRLKLDIADEFYRLEVHEQVGSLGDEFDSIVPPSGSLVLLKNFKSDAAYDPNFVTRVSWDLDGADETLWSSKGSNSLDVIKPVPRSDTDGSKKLAVICENSSLGAAFMTGTLDVEVII